MPRTRRQEGWAGGAPRAAAGRHAVLSHLVVRSQHGDKEGHRAPAGRQNSAAEGNRKQHGVSELQAVGWKAMSDTVAVLQGRLSELEWCTSPNHVRSRWRHLQIHNLSKTRKEKKSSYRKTEIPRNRGPNTNMSEKIIHNCQKVKTTYTAITGDWWVNKMGSSHTME